MPSANVACPVSTSPSRQGAGGRAGVGGGGSGGGAVATQMFNRNFELKRRQQELESMVQGCEEKNTQLHQQNSKVQADLERANARADSAGAEAAALRRDLKIARVDAKSTSAEIEGLRRGAKTANAEIASLRRDVATARDEGARALDHARAEAGAATARAEAAELANVRAAEELDRVKKQAAAKAEDAARKAAKALKVEAAKTAKATAAAAAASKAAASATATAAAAEIAAAASAAEAEKERSQQQQQHGSELQSLAAGLKAIAAGGSETDMSSRPPKPGKKRGRVGTISAAGGAGPGAQRTAKLPVMEIHHDEYRAELSELTTGFCKVLAAYTGQDLALDALLQLIDVTPSQVKGGVVEGDDDEKCVLRALPSVALEGAKQKPRAAAVKQEKLALAVPAVPPAKATATATTTATPPLAPAAPAAHPSVVGTPSESVVPTARPTTSRREMLNARLAQKEKEAKQKELIQEEQERKKAERQREARQKRKREAARAKVAEDARAKAVEAAAHQQAVEAAAREAALALSSAVPPPPPHREHEHEQPQPQTQRQMHKQPQKQPQQKQKQNQEAEVQKKPPRVQHVKSRRAKQAPAHKQREESPAKGAGRGAETSCCGQTTTGPLVVAPEVKPPLPNATLGAAVTSATDAEAKPTRDSEVDSDRIVDHDEMGGVVEEVPMPTGDIGDGLDFFCAPADVGGGGIGLIVGGGGSDGGGYGMVGAWPQLQGDPIAAAVDVDSGASAAVPGEKRKGKGSPRKVETFAKTVAKLATEAGSVGAADGDEVGGGKESKNKRRRSMRWVFAVEQLAYLFVYPHFSLGFCGARIYIHRYIT